MLTESGSTLVRWTTPRRWRIIWHAVFGCTTRKPRPGQCRCKRLDLGLTLNEPCFAHLLPEPISAVSTNRLEDSLERCYNGREETGLLLRMTPREPCMDWHRLFGLLL